MGGIPPKKSSRAILKDLNLSLSCRRLEFSMNDVIPGKITHMAKMATKDESSVDVDFAVC